MEHPTYVSNILCVEVLQVNRRQCRTTKEHAIHVSDILCVEVLQIERSQSRATAEHATHVFHFRSIEILQPFNLLERTIIAEPAGSGGGTEVSERSVEHRAHSGCICLLARSCPCREGTLTRNILSFQNPPCRACAGGTQCIVVEGKRAFVFALHHIGLAGLRLCTLRSGQQNTNQYEDHRAAIK